MMKMYVRFSDLFDEKVAIPTLKKMLRQFKRSDVIYRLAGINATIARVEFQGTSSQKRVELQCDLTREFLDGEVCELLKRKYYEDLVNGKCSIFIRQTILYLIRLAIFECSEDSTMLAAGGSDGGYELGRCILIANDHFVSKRDELATALGSEAKRRRHWHLQLAPIIELYNPTEPELAIPRTERIYSDILDSLKFKKKLRGKLAGLDIAREFLTATGIELDLYRKLTLGLFAWIFADKKGSVHFDRNDFIAQSIIQPEEFSRYLQLEAKSIEQFKKKFATSKIPLRFRPFDFRSTPFIEFLPDKFVCVDPYFLIERLGSGVYWAILDSLPRGKKEHFPGAYGYLFELYVDYILRQFPVGASCFVSFPEYVTTPKESFDGLIYYPETKHLIVLEYKASRMKVDAKYGGKVREFEKELVKKFVRNKRNAAKGLGQIANHLERVFHQVKGKREQLQTTDGKPLPFSPQNLAKTVEKVSPVLIVQEPAFRGLFAEWLLNQKFEELLKGKSITNAIKINPMMVMHIDDLEGLKPHLRATINLCTFEQLVNLRALRDPDYRCHLSEFIADYFPHAQVEPEVECNEILEVLQRASESLFSEDARRLDMLES
jgi:hypothetical protein